MMEVQKYLKQHGIEKLKEEFHIEVKDYPDFVTLNYNQIDSSRFHPVCDECRGLILKKDTWDILAFPFTRFYNLQEGVQISTDTPLSLQRIAAETYQTYNFDISQAIIEAKLDGSLCNVWFSGTKWEVSTRKMAYAEGQTNLGRTFKEVFLDGVKNTKLWDYLNSDLSWNRFTFMFELTGRENRVVTPYEKTQAFLIGARDNLTSRELTTTELDNLALTWNIPRPSYFKVSSYEELLSLVNSFPLMEEGIVLKIEQSEGSHLRIKVKNPAYLAIAHMRENGNISPKNILNLIMSNEQLEYLRYFSEDSSYFSFVEEIYSDVKLRISNIYNECKDIKEQKEFALTIMPKTKYAFEKGIIFSMRKGDNIDDLLKNVGAKKISMAINLKQKFVDKFHVVVGEEDET